MDYEQRARFHKVCPVAGLQVVFASCIHNPLILMIFHMTNLIALQDYLYSYCRLHTTTVQQCISQDAKMQSYMIQRD